MRRNAAVYALIILILIGLIATADFLINYYSYSVPIIGSTPYTIVFYPDCSVCSNAAINAFDSFLSGYGYSPGQNNLSYASTYGNNAVKSNLIAALPSVILPSSAIYKIQDQIVTLEYLNVLSFNQNAFVLNTPFLASIYGPVTFYDLIQNRTITSVNIMNLTKMFNTTINSSLSNLLNPVPFLSLENSTLLRSGNKTTILFVSSDSPFSAIQDVILESALGAFGNFSVPVTQYSIKLNGNSSLSLGPQIYYNLSSMSYSSRYFSLDAEDINSIGNSQLGVGQMFQYDQNALSSVNSAYGNFMPLLDIGGKYVSVSSILRPFVFNGENLSEIASTIRSDNVAGTAFNDSVGFVDAVLCSLINSSEPVCGTSLVRAEMSDIGSVTD